MYMASLQYTAPSSVELFMCIIAYIRHELSLTAQLMHSGMQNLVVRKSKGNGSGKGVQRQKGVYGLALDTS